MDPAEDRAATMIDGRIQAVYSASILGDAARGRLRAELQSLPSPAEERQP